MPVNTKLTLWLPHFCLFVNLSMVFLVVGGFYEKVGNSESKVSVVKVGHTYIDLSPWAAHQESKTPSLVKRPAWVERKSLQLWKSQFSWKSRGVTGRCYFCCSSILSKLYVFLDQLVPKHFLLGGAQTAFKSNADKYYANSRESEQVCIDLVS